jgi:hypothetical protein
MVRKTDQETPDKPMYPFITSFPYQSFQDNIPQVIVEYLSTGSNVSKFAYLFHVINGKYHLFSDIFLGGNNKVLPILQSLQANQD